MAALAYVVYCPSCSATIGGSRRSLDELRHRAQDHAQVTGHVVNLVAAATWVSVETIAGEPSLPLWE
jgi:hypothetical protein